MKITIDFNILSQSACQSLKYTKAKVVEWLERSVVVLKSGMEAVLPYLQDKRGAVVALIVYNLILFKLSDVLGAFFRDHFPANTPFKEKFKSVIDYTGTVALVAFGVKAFVNLTQPPLTREAVVILTFASCCLYAQFC